ncbi:MAG TPA: UDP-2,3-diacylglucosamine diphosphatase [Candidatus Marinimicrobia bacterium]|jgi:UDP-2,3-diacylglucosamine hydrolase|nr:UDP-2,3-diacylglucosamine diphosphatase [Candidatus Neomarinimicrobiota bacterium]
MQLPVYFISDIHLMLDYSEQEKERQQKLFHFLDYIVQTNGTLVIVGDLYDFYFEYKHVIPKVYFPFYQKLYSLKQAGIEVHFITGNHDHWILDFMEDTLTHRVYTDDTTLEISGKKFYLTHGDGILSWDRGYRLLKSILRNKLFIWLYRWVHPTIGYGIAHAISKRGYHYKHSTEYNKKVLSELKVFAETISADGFDYVITGHYHQSTIENVNGGKLVVLGDWIQYFSYGIFDGNELELKFWESDV